MSGNEISTVEDTESAEDNCVVCFKNVDIFSVGVCDHPVCFECSTRMRVLCGQHECPICRQDMPTVVFTKTVEQFAVLKPKIEKLNIQDPKHGICFDNVQIQRRYNRLLEHECKICKKSGYNNCYRTFNQLKEHMRRQHELFYCELCVQYLKIFTFERSVYTRSELATHRRKGDPDNTSHRGHPLCEFCEMRFMDNDELFRHLRRDHLYCHFCDMDGKHQYYSTYADLRRHYQEEHYLCEEGECKYERFTSVFRTDIDLKAHYAAIHGKNLSKAANRQARTLEVEFTLAPRPRNDGMRRNYRQSERQTEDLSGDLEPGGPGGGHEGGCLFSNPLAAENFPSLSGEAITRTVPNVTITSKINPLSEENFPSLGGGSMPPSRSAVTITTSKFNPHTMGNFPSLGASASSRHPAVTITQTVRGPSNSQRNSDKRETWTPSGNFRVSSAATSGRVKLSVNSGVQNPPTAPQVSIHLNHKANGGSMATCITQPNGSVSVRPKSSEDFPALSMAAPIPQPQWVSKKKKESKDSKVAPAPVLPPSGLNDFPTLNKGGQRKSTNVTMPVSNSWVNLNNFNNDAKNNNANAFSSVSNEVPSTSNSEPKLEKKEKKKKSKIELVVKAENKDDKNKKKKKGKNDEVSCGVNRISLVDNKKNEKNTVDPGESSELANGISKKHSELNVDLEVVEDIDDVPKPPPGIPVKPPPGFSFIPTNDLTFTNSSGQSYVIKPSSQFYPPPNFKSRNQFLIEKFKAVFKDSSAIQQFKIYSDMFRVGDISSDRYYEHCESFMGAEFKTIFPELLVLLPNVEKQQELYRAHKSRNGSTKGLDVCATCRQVILSTDLRSHLSNHILDNHFPVLTNATETNNAWNQQK